MATTSVLSRISRISRRSFASVVAEASPLPTRHSRHDPPPACLSAAQLKEVSEEVLESTPGTLIPYEPSRRDDSLHAWEVADVSIQKVEWLIRGYSAQVSNTKMQLVHSAESAEDPAHCVEAIQNLLQRMDKEGSMYMDLRHQMRSQLALEEQQEQEVEQGNVPLEDLATIEKHTNVSTPQVFASPGQTIAMFDTLFDTMSMATDKSTPKTVGSLLQKINDRFEQDGGLAHNVNPNTVPTQMTFNAGLRAIANTENSAESTRDDAVMHAFATFAFLRDTNVKRNAATYAYMIQTVSKFFPPSEMSANIAHALWVMAQEEQVIDTNVMEAMELVKPENYEKYNHFLTDYIQNKTIRDLPHSWRKFGKSFRFENDDDTY